jgi:hypothetical protein
MKEKTKSTSARAARRDAVRELKRAAAKLRGRNGRELARKLRAVITELEQTP